MPNQIEVFSWETMKFIGNGTDSVVYRKDDKVLKCYYSGTPFSVVENYMKLTNDASHFLDENPHSAYVLSKVDQQPLFNARFKVTPIDWVKLGQNNRPVACSAYIPGPHIQAIYQQDGRDWNRLIIDLEQCEREKLEELRKAPQGNHLRKEFSELGDNIAGQFRGEGLYILGFNVKPRFDSTTNEWSFVITDLAANLRSITDLWRKDSAKIIFFAHISRLISNSFNLGSPNQSQ